MDFNDNFADIIIPGADKASFKKMSENAWDIAVYDSEDVYIPSGANTFNYMTENQLRCYFYHRADFKKGVFATKYPAYIYVYIAEVLMRENAAFELAFILSNTANRYPNIKSDLCRYIKDYYIVNEIEIDFVEYIKGIGAENFFPSYMSPPEDDTVAKLFTAGNYDTSKSSFLTAYPEVREALPDIFGAVIENLSPLFSIYDIDPTTLIRGESGETEFYYPFTGVFYAGDFTRQTTAFLTPAERYVRRGSWFMRSVVYTPSYVRKFSSALIRLIETELRRIYEYRYQFIESLSGDSQNLSKLLSSHYLRDIVSEICINFSVSGDVDIQTETSKSLASHIDEEPIKSFREEIKKGSPLASLSISEYAEYLLWHAKIERGIYEESPFVSLYINSLTPNDESLRQLCLILKNIPTKEIVKTLPEKIKLYSGQNFESLTREYGITEYFPDVFIHSTDLNLRAEAILRIAAVKDKFITDETKPFVNTAVNAVFDKVRQSLIALDIPPDELFFEGGNPEKKLFPLVLKFICKKTLSVLKNTQESFEIFKQKFSGNLDLRYRAGVYMARQTRLWQSSKEYFLSDGFAEMIGNTAVSIYKENFSHIKHSPAKKVKTVLPEPAPEPIEVKVDFSKLVDVRKTADEITEKLIVPEETKPVIETKPVSVLDENLKTVLKLVADGGDYMAYLRDKNILPEVAVESINEAALEIIGDIIIEDFRIIEDYKDEVKDLLL
ncbi:MAG: hypothetical protein LBM41_07775 [Ruminococcus sp.]|jgi:hypothetical protein|nr:hypothetical protein [Ruminococcus sp.]